MPTRRLHQVLDNLRRTALARDGAGASDGELLTHFVQGRDPAAFEALVRRHGPMVLGVCRRVLGNAHDAEDAFQATFLVLLRRAPSIGRRDLLGNWLYGVAYRTARAARAQAARHRAHEKQVETMPHPTVEPTEVWSELRPLLDGELAALPDKYRVPVVLCDLEGRTRKEVARRLRIPEGTLSSRLATARQRLAQRLSRRGVTLSGGALAALLSGRAASARAPSALVASVVQAAAGAGPGQAVLSVVPSARVAALASEVLAAMTLAKLKAATALLVVTAISLALAVALASSPTPAAPREDVSAADRTPATRIVVPAALVEDGKLSYRIIAVNPETGAWEKVSSTYGDHPRVSPDGQTVVFVGDGGIWNCDTRGSDNPARLFEWSGYGGPAWSPDGRHLFHTTLQSSLGDRVWVHESWRCDADGRNPTKLNLPPGEAILDVASDGEHCLTRSRVLTGLNQSALMIMKLGGTEARRLSPPGGFNEPGRFAPDGRRVAYCRNDEDGHSLRVVNTDGTGGRTVLEEAGVFVEGCCWSPDGRRLAVVLADLLPRPDGKRLIPYGREEGRWRIEVLDADGQKRRPVPLRVKVVSLRSPEWYAPPR